MLQKRPFGEEIYDVSPKQPRHLEPSDERVSVLEFPAFHKSKTECDEMLDGGYLSELPSCNENEIVPPCSISNSLGTASTTSEEDVKAEVPCCVLLSPDHYNLELPATTVIPSRDIYSYLLEHPPQKLVPIGDDFQAELPEWGGHGETFTGSSSRDASEVLNVVSESFKSDTCDRSIDGDKFTGYCIYSMAELPLSADADEMVGPGRICCSCDDMGSIRCVRKHISEAREKLRNTLGEKAFTELGFCDMGELVAEKWSEDEEDIFREVVFHNAAFRRNFWDELASELPSRTKKEIVSHYFNVFMLRRRAEQNRVDVLDIDSDNNMWEGVHFSADDIIHKLDASDDSGDESPEHKDDFGHEENYGNNLCKDNEVSTLGTSEDKTDENVDRNKCISGMAEICPNDAIENCSSGAAHLPLDQVVSDELQKHCVQDVPCPSDSCGIATDVVRSKDHGMRHWTSNLSGLSSSSGGHEFPIESRSSKEWDVGYLTCSKDEEFIPTCSVVEEVFGSGVCNYKTNC